MKTRSDNRITVIQYLCSYIIVVLHSYNVPSWNLTSMPEWIRQLENIVNHFCVIAVPIFFFFTGYLFFISFTPNKWGGKIKKRCRTLLIPYIIWNLWPWLLFAVVTNQPTLAGAVNMERVELNAITFFEAMNSAYSPLWYVRNIMILALLSIGLYFLLKNKLIAILAIIILCILNLFHHFSYFGIVYWLPEYLIGGYMGLHCQRFTLNNIESKFTALLCAGVLIAIGIAAWFATADITFWLYRLSAAVLLPTVLGNLIPKEITILWPIKLSFFIYCVHYPFVAVIGKLFKVLLGANAMGMLLCYFLTPPIIIAVITITAYLWKRLLPKSWAIVSGGRS